MTVIRTIDALLFTFLSIVVNRINQRVQEEYYTLDLENDYSAMYG